VENVGPILKIEGLSKRYGSRWAVKGLDLQVPRGEVFGFLGPNGAGKTTTIRMMLGLITPASGSVLINGIDARRNPLAALSGVGAIVESPAFYGYLSGRQNLEILGQISGGVPPSRVDETLELVGLASRAADRVKGYSQGMRQRLGIAQALLHRPDMVVLDEPTNGLDPSGMREVRELVQRLAREFGITVFLSSHLLYEVEAVCDRVAVISNGELVTEGRVKELLRRESVDLDVRVSDRRAALAAIERMGIASGVNEAGEDTLSMSIPQDSVAGLNRALVEMGLDVYSLVPHPPTLEDFFLEMTSGQSGDRQATGRRSTD
jgi:ABC-2 type transport system ATP-binding protein